MRRIQKRIGTVNIKNGVKNMVIGIDIDDTLTDIRDELKAAALNYAQKLGKKINTEITYIEDKNNGNTYQEKYNFTYEELKYFLKVIQEDITQNAKPRKGAKETLKKLREEGNKIYIVIARDYEFHDAPYLLSKEWLDKNGIEYDKIIVNARDKVAVCKEEKINLFIDDQLANCMKISSAGIKVIRITNYTDIHGNIVNKKNWEEIYQFIQTLNQKDKKEE